MSSSACIGAILLGIAAACGGETPPSIPPPHAEVAPPPPPLRATPPPEPSSSAAIAPPPVQQEPRPRAEPLTVPPAVEKIVAAPDRAEADRKLDAGRHPGEFLTFLGLAPGMRAAELLAGTGYTTELIARTVGPTGRVWAENPAGFLKFVEKPYKERLAKPAMKNVVRADLEVDAPLPPEARNLDAVVSVLVYHDTVWLGVDRDKMNKAAFNALKKGGEYVVIDHSAATGHGTEDVKTLHRIDEGVVVAEVLRAGFEQGPSSNFLRNPEDGRDWNDAPNAAAEKRGTSDRFALKFIRP
jgi:predicted methyltransferase